MTILVLWVSVRQELLCLELSVNVSSIELWCSCLSRDRMVESIFDLSPTSRDREALFFEGIETPCVLVHYCFFFFQSWGYHLLPVFVLILQFYVLIRSSASVEAMQGF